MPGDAFVSTAWQMPSAAWCSSPGRSSPASPATCASATVGESLLALAYLVVFGSWLAFTAYTWLLQNAPISQVATYAYVNPLVAVLLGWTLLDEHLGIGTLAGAALVVASVGRDRLPESAGRADEHAAPPPRRPAAEKRVVSRNGRRVESVLVTQLTTRKVS